MINQPQSTEIKDIALAIDFARRREWEGKIIQTHISHANRLYYLLNNAISFGSGLPVRTLTAAEYLRFEQVFCKAFGYSQDIDHLKNWSESYYSDPPQELLDLLAETYQNSIVLGFELSPMLRKALDQLSIIYIDTLIYSVSYLPQIIYAFYSNLATLNHLFGEHAIPKYDFYAGAAYETLRYTPNIGNVPLPDNTLFIVGQTQFDRSVIAPEGRFYSLLEFIQQIEALMHKHSHTLFKPHPFGTDPEVTAYFSQRKDVTIINSTDSKLRSIYGYLAHPAISTFAGINSGLLIEASFFKKQYVNFIPFIADFLSYEQPELATIETVFPIELKTIVKPSFWHDLLSVITPLSVARPQDREPAVVPNLRILYRGGSNGNEYDDAQSFTQCLKIHNLEQRVGSLEKNMADFSQNNQLDNLQQSQD